MSTIAAIPYEAVEIDINSFEITVSRLLCSIKPRWASKKLVFKKLNTDDNFIRYAIFLKDSDDEQSGVVVKIYPTNSNVYIDHQEQFRLIAHYISRGIAPRILLSFINGYYSVYIQGKILDVKEPQTHQLIARKMAGFHSIPVGSQGLQLIDKLTHFIDLFTNKNVILHDRLIEMKKENAKLNNTNHRSLFASFKSVIGRNNIPTFPLTFDQLELQLKDISWPELSTEIDRIRSIFQTNWSSLDIPIVLCLNNMKLNNFLFDAKNDSISIIDFDHCSHNYCLIDIVSYFLELAKDDYETKYPHRNLQKQFLSEYLKHSKLNMSNIIYDPRQPTDRELEHLCDLCGLLIAPVHLYWALWAFLQVLLVQPISTVDYLNYGKIHLAQYQRHKGNFFLPFNHSQKDFPKF